MIIDMESFEITKSADIFEDEELISRILKW